MAYNFWTRDSELFKQVEVDHTQGTASGSNPQLQQSLHSNSYDDDTLHQVTYSGDPTNNDHLQAPSHNFGCVHLPLSDFSSPSPPIDEEIAQRDIELEMSFSNAAGLQLPRNAHFHYDTDSLQACLPRGPLHQHDLSHHSGHLVNDRRVVESHALSGHVFICEWHDGSRLCGETVYARGIAEHMTSCHLGSGLPGSHLLRCRWKDCRRKQHLRRDTVVRHTVEKHLGIKYRSKAWLARVLSH